MRVTLVLRNGCTFHYQPKRLDDHPSSRYVTLYDDKNVRMVTFERRDIQTLDIIEDPVPILERKAVPRVRSSPRRRAPSGKRGSRPKRQGVVSTSAETAKPLKSLESQEGEP